MKSFSSLILLLSAVSSNAFVAQQQQQSSRATELNGSRRAFVEAAVGAAFLGIAAPAFADDDLSMPSAEEQAAQDAAMAEKVRRKRELQKQATKPTTFSDSLKGELKKKEELGSMTKEEKRNRMCEELGRGC